MNAERGTNSTSPFKRLFSLLSASKESFLFVFADLFAPSFFFFCGFLWGPFFGAGASKKGSVLSWTRLCKIRRGEERGCVTNPSFPPRQSRLSYEQG